MTAVLEALNQPFVFHATVILSGLIVGSFLNVVIHRLPVMLEREWRSQCAELHAEAGSAGQEPPYNLITPPSTCPACGHRIRAWENIPLISYLFLRGRCSHCATPIGLRYPLVELAAALMALVVAWHFGSGHQAMAGMVLSWVLLVLAVIDLRTQLLPDVITLPTLWLGLLLSLVPVFADTHAAVIGAVAAYLSLWLVFQGFKLLTGKEGMGYGDFKLFALLGAWLGWQALPVVILLSTVIGAAVGIGMILVRGHDRQIPIPFGPYLAGAGWVAMLWGEDLTRWYLRWAGW